MKKYIKTLLLIFLILFLSYFFGCHVPIISEQVNKKIEIGKRSDEVIKLATSYPQNPHLCGWKVEGQENQSISNRGQCNQPENISFNKPTSKPVELYILFMGPAFLHNDFKVMFSSDGKVTSKTKTKHWD